MGKKTPIKIIVNRTAHTLSSPTVTLKVLSLNTRMVGKSLSELKWLVNGFAVNRRQLLFTGEPGTGKELLAEIYAESIGKELFPLNCAGMSESTAISKLFGHEKGSFTGATQARSGMFSKTGVIFLDELGAASDDFKAMLLRVLENGDYAPLGSDKNKKISKDTIVCAATNEPDNIRQDLRDRFTTLNVPPLRARMGDIPELVKELSPKEISFISNDALKILTKHNWPGNVRELRHTMQIATDLALFDGKDTIRVQHLVTLSGEVADSSRKWKISSLKAKAIVFPRREFFKPFVTPISARVQFWDEPGGYKKKFYQYFSSQGYTPDSLHKRFRTLSVNTIKGRPEFKNKV